jgi:ribosomal protein S18 acetylase RimI-like enzyme
MRNDVDTPVTIRPARRTDRPALDGLVERSSDDTLYRRFHGGAAGPIRRELDRIAAPSPDHRSWIAVSPADGRVRGTATLAWPTRPGGAVEAAFLVEDAWRRRGIGRALFDALMVEAAHAGLPSVHATVQADNERALRFLRGVGPGAASHYAGGHEVEVSVPVPAPRPLPTAAQEAA